MKLKLTIRMDNAAFENNEGPEVARILRRLAGEYEERNRLLGYPGAPRECTILKDVNGNTVGRAEVVE